MGKVNGCPKGIGLGTIFRNILWEKKKVMTFLTAFYISHESDIKTFLKNGLLANVLRPPVNRTLIN